MDDEVVADIVPVSASREAVADADVVCTATTADAAVFDGAVYRDRLSRRT